MVVALQHMVFGVGLYPILTSVGFAVDGKGRSVSASRPSYAALTRTAGALQTRPMLASMSAFADRCPTQDQRALWDAEQRKFCCNGRCATAPRQPAEGALHLRGFIA